MASSEDEKNADDRVPVGCRVLIFGAPGSGKSTLARALGERLDVPVIHFDRLYWTDGWKPRSSDEVAAIVEASIAGDDWVFDGNNSLTLQMRAERADTLIWLDLPRMICFARVLVRTARSYGNVRADMADGCPERFDPTFLRWAWNFSVHSRPGQLSFFERSSIGRKHHLTRPSQVRKLLAAVDRRSALPVKADGLGGAAIHRP